MAAHVIAARSLAARFPEIARQWHPTKNGSVRPEDVTSGSRRPFSWQCPRCDHTWRAAVHKRTSGSGCPACAGRVATRSTALAAQRPDLVREWDARANAPLTPWDVVPGSEKEVAWRCHQDPSHKWRTPVAKRARRGQGCPYCSGKRITAETSLAGAYPDIAREWDARRNGGRRPEEVHPGSREDVGWRCWIDPAHRWIARVEARTRLGTGCPMCAGRMLTPVTSLRGTHPHLADEWHPTQNGTLTPDDVSPASQRMVRWRCPTVRSHVWRAKVASRARGAGCPMCSGRVATPSTSLRRRAPRIARQWHPTLNGDVTPDDVTFRSARVAVWQCPRDECAHAWRARIDNRVAHRMGCPACSNKVVTDANNLLAREPEVALRWHPSRNKNLRPEHVLPGSERVVWWQCERDGRHAWQASIASRVAGRGCPHCGTRIAGPFNCLAVRHRALAAEWHPTRNKPLTPKDVVPGSNRRVWWRCSRNPRHCWEAVIAKRALRGDGCGICARGRKCA